jgi:hypothetical protein
MTWNQRLGSGNVNATSLRHGAVPVQGYSSLGRSIAVFAEVEPPPVESLLEAGNLRGVSPMATMNPPVRSEVNNRSGLVSRANRMKGDRELYSRGNQRNSMMTMMATGQVQRSRFQPFSGHTWVASFNDELYRSGGYPQNLGLSFKASSIPDGVATNPAWGRMRPAPQITRSVFTRRRYSGAAAVAAKPQSR